MSDPTRAAQLVTDDALLSRGLVNAPDLVLATDERELHGNGFEPLAASATAAGEYELTMPSTRKGKGRYVDSEDEAATTTAGESSDHFDRDDGTHGFRTRAGTGHTRGGSYSRIELGSASTRRRGSAARDAEKLDERTLRILWWKSAAINVLYILAWYCFSMLISLYNKWMFSEEYYNFPYPLFVTSIHMLVQWLLAALTLSIFPRLRPTNRPQPRDYATKVGPCGVATGLDIGLSNLSLRSITLSFYTMCKSSSLAFVLLFAFLFRLEKPSWRLAGIILIITAGVILMVSTETQFDFVGMIQVLSASALGGLRWSLTQMLLHKESMGMGNPIATLFWLAPIMGATLGLCSIVFDGWGKVFSHEEFWGSLWLTLKTTVSIMLPGVLAFAMNVTEFGLIQRTSVVTLSVAGIFKEVAVIFVSTVIFGDQLTAINISGLCVTIFGIALYNYLKYQQYTKDPSKHGHGPPMTHGGFDDTTEDAHEEGRPMLDTSQRGRPEEGLASSTTAAGPHHSLGDDDFDATADADYIFDADARSLDAQASELLGDFEADSAREDHLVKLSEADKAHQHDADRIPELDALLKEDDELRETERKAEEMRRELERGKKSGESGGGGASLSEGPLVEMEDLLDSGHGRTP
ncbi:hypothetical protein JCM10908_006340 [Rhodotorula pacifica]|uniref:uncharacterized protein n=1 Tax=Rhodotorula pacifica TaxID=1495444 RepID=UPI003181DF0D